VKPLAERLNQKAIPRNHTLEHVLHRSNIDLAWKSVRSNKGAAGVDGMKIGEFPSFFQDHWEMIESKLRDGSYRPSPVRQCQIPKGNGAYRTLGIPTVLDRVIQQAIAQVIGAHHEAKFSDSSHGYRPHRSAQGAMKQLLEHAKVRGKKCTVVDCDLKQFFDTIDHQLMMQKLRESIADEALLEILIRFLRVREQIRASKIRRRMFYEQGKCLIV
jgi:RNA-directed DNA polymerase